SVGRPYNPTTLASPEHHDRPPHKHPPHDEIDQKRAKLGKIIFAGHVADAEQARSDERAADGAEPADGNHDQDVDEIGEGKCVIEADDLDGKRAAEARTPAAERKSDGAD